MKKSIACFILLIAVFLGCKRSYQTQVEEQKMSAKETNSARDIIAKVIAETGSMDDLKKLKDVEYTYHLDATNRNIKNVSIERYIFNNELSWARYLPDQQFPVKEDTITQGYDGKSIWVHINQNLTNDSKKIEYASFIRNTNFYWFTMMQKLLDDGVRHKLLDTRTINTIEYQIVEMSFDQNIGEVQDKYLLYINPQTNLIDQFLFTVKERNLAPVDPLLMIVEYKLVDGIRLMANRTVKKSDWNGKNNGEIIYKQYYTNIKFSNGFTPDMFESKFN